MDKDVLEKCGEVKVAESVAGRSGDKVWPMTKELVGCGYPKRNPEVDLRIVNMEDCSELEEGKVQFCVFLPCLSNANSEMFHTLDFPLAPDILALALALNLTLTLTLILPLALTSPWPPIGRRDLDR